MRNSFFLLCVVLLVKGVPGDDNVEVPVLTGDSVTLMPDDVKVKQGDLILWKFNGSLIYKMEKTEDSFIITDKDPDKKFISRLEPDETTGSLTITNIGIEHNGVYQVEMKINMETSKSYSVTVHGNVKSISVLEGDSVTLHTGVTKTQGDQIKWKFGDENLNDDDVDYTITNICQNGDYKVEIHTSSTILHRKFPINCNDGKTLSKMEEQSITLGTGLHKIQGYDQILWKFRGKVIAEINQVKNLRYGTEGRYWIDENSGSLTIIKTKNTDYSGIYHLEMKSRSHTLLRNISVADSGAISGIYSASFGLVVWAVTVSLLQV